MKVKEEVGLIFEFCVVIVQGGYTPRAWLPSDLVIQCLWHLVAKIPEQPHPWCVTSIC